MKLGYESGDDSFFRFKSDETLSSLRTRNDFSHFVCLVCSSVDKLAGYVIQIEVVPGTKLLLSKGLAVRCYPHDNLKMRLCE